MKLKLYCKNKVMNAATKIGLSKLVNSQFKDFSKNIRKVDVQVDDIPTHRHGVLAQCSISITLPGLPSIAVKAKGKDSYQALKRALKSSMTVITERYKLSPAS